MSQLINDPGYKYWPTYNQTLIEDYLKKLLKEVMEMKGSAINQTEGDQLARLLKPFEERLNILAQKGNEFDDVSLRSRSRSRSRRFSESGTYSQRRRTFDDDLKSDTVYSHLEERIRRYRLESEWTELKNAIANYHQHRTKLNLSFLGDAFQKLYADILSHKKVGNWDKTKLALKELTEYVAPYFSWSSDLEKYIKFGKTTADFTQIKKGNILGLTGYE